MAKSEIIGIGVLVEDFKEENLIVLFDETAPEELRDISVIHRFEEEPEDVLQEGKKLFFGDQEYTIQKVGKDANQNFASLGHISIYFKEQEDLLPGAVIVSPSEFPELNVGELITVK